MKYKIDKLEKYFSKAYFKLFNKKNKNEINRKIKI
jgi:hypothetical protein